MERPVVGITLGDQAGIGPEIVEKALSSGQLPNNVDYKILVDPNPEIVPGEPSLASAQAALDGLEIAAKALNAGEIAAVCTAPVSKDQLRKVAFTFPGQTEFFADRLGSENFAMCLTGRRLTVGLVTIHQSLASVPACLQKGEIVRVGRLLAEFCRRRHARPAKIAVCGLNPHAGENGAFGTEETTTIHPAIDELNLTGSDHFTGPHPADTVFYPASQGRYDAVLCMYHDQGLIPLKLLDFATGVNTTLGLPNPRTSPDHGTAFDIAGKNVADPSSMIHAIQLAAELAL